jgi:hypothetical protein
MSFDSNRKAFSDYVTANWPGPWAIVGENLPPPSDRTKAWVRYSMRPANSQAWDIMSKVERTVGTLYFNAYLPQNQGPNDASRIADAVRKMCFEKQIVDALGVLIYMRAATLNFVGQDSSGFQVWKIQVPYQADADPTTQ